MVLVLQVIEKFGISSIPEKRLARRIVHVDVLHQVRIFQVLTYLVGSQLRLQAGLKYRPCKCIGLPLNWANVFKDQAIRVKNVALKTIILYTLF